MKQNLKKNMKMFKISRVALLQIVITVALFNSNTSASTHYDSLRSIKKKN